VCRAVGPPAFSDMARKSRGQEREAPFMSVAVRIKPADDGGCVVACAPRQDDGDACTEGQALYCDTGYGTVEEYEFSRVFGPEDNNISLFRDLRGSALVNSIFTGINETLFAYGQTGSGKTHTIFGSGEEPGLLKYFVREVFEKAEQSPASTVHVCCYEVFGDMLTDLIDTTSFIAQGELRPQDVVSDELFLKTQKYQYQIVHVSCLSTCLELLRTACENRSTGTSSCNTSSSRSHAIVHIFVQNPVANVTSQSNCIDTVGEASREGAASDDVSVGALTLVDLAGAEKEYENPSDQGRRSTRLLNISLSSLNRLLRKLQTNSLNESERRQSVMCKCLWEYLRPGCGIALIFCVSAMEGHREATLSTLAMAADSRLIHCRRKASVFPALAEAGLHCQQMSASGMRSRTSSPASSACATPRRSRPRSARRPSRVPVGREEATPRTRCKLNWDVAARHMVLTPATDGEDGSRAATEDSELSHPLGTKGGSASSSGCLSTAGSSSTVDSERFSRPHRASTKFSQPKCWQEDLTKLSAENDLLRTECEMLRAMYARQQRQQIEFWKGSYKSMFVPPERAPRKRISGKIVGNVASQAISAREETMVDLMLDRSAGELQNSSRLIAVPSPSTSEVAGPDCLQTVQAERDYWRKRAAELKQERDDALQQKSANTCAAPTGSPARVASHISGITATGTSDLHDLSHAVLSDSTSSLRSLAPLGLSDSRQTLPPASP